jgi:hypothetical protein
MPELNPIPPPPNSGQRVVDESGFMHVHDCWLAANELECRYDWSAHDLSGDGSACPCEPHIDRSNADVDGALFVVHKGHE